MLVFAVLLGAARAGAAPATRPNLIWIIADDLGYGDLGSYGQKIIKTPHLDRMAREGLCFTQFYAGATVCAPSRSVLMTGQHHKNDVAEKNNVASQNPEIVAQIEGYLKSARLVSADRKPAGAPARK